MPPTASGDHTFRPSPTTRTVTPGNGDCHAAADSLAVSGIRGIHSRLAHAVALEDRLSRSRARNSLNVSREAAPSPISKKSSTEVPCHLTLRAGLGEQSAIKVRHAHPPRSHAAAEPITSPRRTWQPEHRLPESTVAYHERPSHGRDQRQRVQQRRRLKPQASTGQCVAARLRWLRHRSLARPVPTCKDRRQVVRCGRRPCQFQVASPRARSSSVPWSPERGQDRSGRRRAAMVAKLSGLHER